MAPLPGLGALYSITHGCCMTADRPDPRCRVNAAVCFPIHVAFAFFVVDLRESQLFSVIPFRRSTRSTVCVPLLPKQNDFGHVSLVPHANLVIYATDLEKGALCGKKTVDC